MKGFISVIGKDRVGILAAVSNKCAEYNVNIADVSQTVMSDMFTMESLHIFVAEIFSADKVSEHLSGYEMGIFFSIFVMLQFWNLFNAKYFRTGRSLFMDIVDLFRAPQRVKESYNGLYLIILAVIFGGQIAIVTFAGQFFGVSPLPVEDWVLICLVTMPVLLFPDIVRTIKAASKRR